MIIYLRNCKYLFPLILWILTTSSDCLDCNSDNKLISRPTVLLDFLPRAPTEGVEKFIRLTEELITIRCTHNKPIEWVYAIDNLSTTKTMTNYVHRNVSVNPNEYNADLTIVYDTRKDTIFICQTASRENECERSYVEYNHLKRHKQFTNVSVPRDIFANDIKKLWDRPQKEGQCEANLHIKEMANNSIFYKWMPRNQDSKLRNRLHKSFPHFIDFWNAFSQYDYERNCTVILNGTEECKGCKELKYIHVGPAFQRNFSSNGIAFYIEVDGQPVVQKGMFDFYRGNDFLDRKFIMLPNVKLEDMMYFEIDNNEDSLIMYTDFENEVNCWVSVFYFASGTIITYESDPTLENNTSNEIFNNHGSRMVTNVIKFNAEHGNTTQNITCFAPLLRSENWLNRSREVSVEFSSEPEILQPEPPENIVTAENKDNVSISCQFRGKPTPKIIWELPKQEYNEFVSYYADGKENEVWSQITFPKMKHNYTGIYKCTGKNFKGEVSRTITISYPPNELSTVLKVSLGISSGVAIFIFIGVILLLIKRLKFEEAVRRTQTNELMKEFREGCAMYSKDTFSEHFSILQKPYNGEFEVPRDRWSIGNRVLGSGEYGIVRQGTVKVKDSDVKVAIKTTKPRIDMEDFKGFLDELKIMAFIGVHDNIVSLVAAFSEDNNSSNVLIGVEFCDNGSLLDYITDRRQSFINMVSPEGEITTDFNPKAIEAATSELGGGTNMSTIDLYKWSYEIATGMEYLGSKKVMHADLATRNVLLSATNQAKIGDFGMSRILQNSENYTKKTRCPLPWKWMAIESLKEMNFSTSSDMWAYGVTLWELFTLCDSPWSKHTWSLQFIEELEAGMRLPRPFGCTNNVYNNVMMPSWHPDPTLRLRFSDAKKYFKDILDGSLTSA